MSTLCSISAASSGDQYILMAWPPEQDLTVNMPIAEGVSGIRRHELPEPVKQRTLHL